MRDDSTFSISAEEPREDPIGMGYAGVITSEMFGLNAAVDTTTQNLLETQRKLSSKSDLSDSEKEELERTTDQLDGWGFRYQMRDPVYTEYLRARAENTIALKLQADEAVGRLDPDEARRLVMEVLSELKDDTHS
jgi:hypothetical protein